MALVWPLLTLLWFPANYLALIGPGDGVQFLRGALEGRAAPALPGVDVRAILPSADPAGLVSWLLLGLGLGVAAWQLGLRAWLWSERGPRVRRSSPFDWWLLLSAGLIPIVLSLPTPDAAALFLAPLLPIVVGAGAAALWKGVGLLVGGRWRRSAQAGLAALLGVLLGWPLASRIPQQTPFAPPAPVMAIAQNGLLEAATLAARYAPRADEVWVDTDTLAEPWLYVLAAQALAPAAPGERTILPSQGTAATLTRLGKYRFTSLAAVPADLLLLEVVPDGVSQSGFLIQRWDTGGRQIIIMRRMPGA